MYVFDSIPRSIHEEDGWTHGIETKVWPYREARAMTRWLHSGRRRDICFLLGDGRDRRGQELKSALEDHYDRHIEPASFYDSLDALVSAGYVAVRTEGVADVYSLTEHGEDALLQHYKWIQRCLNRTD